MQGRETAQEREIRRRTEHEKVVRVMDEQMKAVNEVNRKLVRPAIQVSPTKADYLPQIPMTESASKSRQTMESLARDSLVNTRLLIGLHQNIIQGPQVSAGDSIKLDDALGRAFSLPYAYFNHWEVHVIAPCCSFC